MYFEPQVSVHARFRHPVRPGRRRLLGAFAAIGSVPTIAGAWQAELPEAVPAYPPPSHGPGDIPARAGDVEWRERWLLRRDDR